MQKTVGIRPQGLRPPYGATTPQINKIAQTPIIQWSVDSLDWESKNVDQIEQVVMNEVYDGSIILMHDIYDTSVDGAARVIQKLKIKATHSSQSINSYKHVVNLKILMFIIMQHDK